MGCPSFLKNALCVGDLDTLCVGIWTPSNTWFLGLTPVHTPNGILISSAIFAGFVIMTDRQTVCNNRLHLHSTAVWPNNNMTVLNCHDGAITCMSSLLYGVQVAWYNWVITHRRSIVERGGCFQRHLFVCLSVCLFVNTITYEWLNVGWWNFLVRCTVQKSRLNSNLGVKGQGLRSPGTKNEKVRHFVCESFSGAQFSFGIIVPGAIFGGASMPVGKSAHAV